MARNGAMLCYPFTKKRLSSYNLPVFLQPKLDGLRCRALVDPVTGDIGLYSSEQNEIICVPHINKALSKFLDVIMERLPLGTDDGDSYAWVELDGELYTHNLTFQEIVSRAKRTKNLHPHHSDIEYHIFDMIVKGEETMLQKERIAYLNASFGIYQEHQSELGIPSYSPIQLVPTYVAGNVEEVYNGLKQMIRDGYEGIIIRDPHNKYVRKRSTQMMKWKPRKSDSYPIVGYMEEVSIQGEPKDALGALICKCEKSYEHFNVGSGSFLTREGRIDLWKKRDDLIGKRAVIKYQELTDDKKIPRFPVLINIE